MGTEISFLFPIWHGFALANRIQLDAVIHPSHTSHTIAVILRKCRLRNTKAANEGSMHSRFYYVYIMTNRSKTLYAGVTRNLEKRVFEHKHGIHTGFTSRYKIDRLVYFERFTDIRNAIFREKQIKGLLRIKKNSPHSLDESRMERLKRGLVRDAPL
jgi:putative endonuclease